MVRRLLALVLFGGVLVPLARADTFELKREKVKVTRENGDILPEIELRSRAFPQRIAEPRYRSDHPQKFLAQFADALDIPFVVDERRGPGKGFDWLIVDDEVTGDLNEGRKIVGKPFSRSYSYIDVSFKPFDIQLPASDASVDYPVQVRFSTRRDELEDTSLYLTSLCILKGSVKFGGKKQNIVVFDSNCNGVFGEKGTVRGKQVSGDKVWIGTGSSKIDTAAVEALPLGMYYLFDGEYYEITVNPEDTITIEKASVPLGEIEVNNKGFLLELVQGSSVVYVSNEDDTTVPVPVGSYRLNTVGFRVRHKGKVWELQGEPGSCEQSFKVDEGALTKVEVGPPIKIVITTTVDQRPGLTVSHDFAIEGSNGEKYRYILKNGRKVNPPELSIRTSKGKEVKETRFEYG